MSIISRLSVILGLDSAQFSAGLGKAEGDVTKFAGAVKGVGVAAVATMAATLVATAKEAVQFADDMTELAKANDMAVSSVLEMSSALSTSGGKIENTSKILSAFTNKVDEAAQGSQKTRDKFKELGVSLDDIGKLSEQDLLRKTIEGLSKIEDPIRRNALAFDLLGKGIKGVDLKDFNKDLENVKGSYDKSEESFRRIEEWGNKIAKSWFDAKVAMADYIVALADSVEKNKTAMAERNDYSRAFYGLPKQDTSKFSPIDTTGRPDFSVSPVVGGRELKQSDEMQKVLDKIQSQKDALGQNIMTLERQNREIWSQKSLYEQINQEFEKGGKYDQIKDAKLKARLIDLAKENDLYKAFDGHNKRAEAFALAMYEQGKEIQRQVIERKDAQRESVDAQVKELENQAERLKYERDIANLSDTQREKAMAYFDLKQKIIGLGKDPLWTDEQIARIETANQKIIEAADQTRRYENTFAVGFNRAFENFKERATDSFSTGQAAFQSMASSMETALDQFVSKGKISFGSLTQSILQDLVKIQLRAQMSGLFSSLFGGLFGGSIGSMPEAGLSFDQLYNMGTGGYADGGTPPVGVPSLVGERGPELFIPKTSGTIIPNNQLSNMMGNNQPAVVYNAPVVQNMSAIDTQSAMQFLSKYKDGVWAANQSANRSMPMSR